jgi:thioesterase domain-containing protein
MIATQLQAQGEQVERLILFDSYPPTPWLKSETKANSIDEIWGQIALGTNLDLFAEAASGALDAAAIHCLARKQSHILGFFSLRQLEELAAITANNARLLCTARLDTFDGDITLFVSTRKTPGLDRTDASPEAWRSFCQGSIRRIDVDAEHHQMLSPEAVKQMGGLLL